MVILGAERLETRVRKWMIKSKGFYPEAAAAANKKQ